MIQRPSLTVILLLLLLLATLVVLPSFASPYFIKFATRVIVMALFVISLDLLIGVTGLISFGHAAFFGLGAYAVFFVSPKEEGANLLIALGAALILSGSAAAIIGAFAVRTRGFYFIMVTLAASQMLFSLFHDTRMAGGSDGASINVKPELVLGGATLIDLSNRNSLYFLALALLVLGYLFALRLATSPFGRVLQGIRWNESRMTALGFETYRFKLAIFIIAGMMAGLSGALFASIDGFVPPELLGWRESGLAIMMVVLGGTGTLFGPILGAIVYSLAEEIFKSSSLVGAAISAHWPIPMGLLLIAAVLGAPKGLGGAWPVIRRVFHPRVPSGQRVASTTAHLSVHGVGKHFGGLKAVDGITLAFPPNKIHAIIGPNGAGKTTFTNLLSGGLSLSVGSVSLDGRDISALSAPARAKMGLGRSFQRTNIIPAFSIAENCLIAAQAHQPSVLRTAQASQDEHEAASFALVAAGLEEGCNRRASDISHGEQRQLEIAMLIASGAKILILDEPLAGTGPEETQRVTALLRDLTRDHTIILIEHDMDAVFSIADTIAVLVGGRLLAHGSPDAIRTDPAVREAYLGDFGQKRKQ